MWLSSVTLDFTSVTAHVIYSVTNTHSHTGILKQQCSSPDLDKLWELPRAKSGYKKSFKLLNIFIPRRVGDSYSTLTE